MIPMYEVRNRLGLSPNEFNRMCGLFGVSLDDAVLDDDKAREMIEFKESEDRKDTIRIFPPFVDADFIADVLGITTSYVCDILRTSGYNKRVVRQIHRRSFYECNNELWQEVCK